MLKVAAGLAWRQLSHRGAKLAGALAGVCVAIVLIFTQVGFRNALYDSACGITRSLDTDILVTGATFHSWGDAPPWLPRALLYEAAAVPGVKSALPLYVSAIQTSSPVDGHSMSTSLLAFPSHAPVFLKPEINAQLDMITVPNRVLMDRKSRDDFQEARERFERSGALTLTLIGAMESLQKTVDVAGLYLIGPSFTIDGTMVTSDMNYHRITGIPLDRISLGLVRVAEGAEPARVKAAIEAKLGNRARVFLKSEFMDNEIHYYSRETPIGTIFNMGLVVGTIVGIVFISQALHGIVNDNIREYAALRAVGYSQGFFVMLVSVVSLAISVVAYLPSCLAAWGVYSLAAAATKLPLVMKPMNMLTILGVVVVMGQVATLFAIKRLKNANPVDLFG